MERIKTFFASAMIALIVFAGFGLGIMAVGFAIVLGAAFALALRLSGAELMANVGKSAEEMPTDERGRKPAAA